MNMHSGQLRSLKPTHLIHLIPSGPLEVTKKEVLLEARAECRAEARGAPLAEMSHNESRFPGGGHTA